MNESLKKYSYREYLDVCKFGALENLARFHTKCIKEAKAHTMKILI